MPIWWNREQLILELSICRSLSRLKGEFETFNKQFNGSKVVTSLMAVICVLFSGLMLETCFILQSTPQNIFLVALNEDYYNKRHKMPNQDFICNLYHLFGLFNICLKASRQIWNSRRADKIQNCENLLLDHFVLFLLQIIVIYTKRLFYYLHQYLHKDNIQIIFAFIRKRVSTNILPNLENFPLYLLTHFSFTFWSVKELFLVFIIRLKLSIHLHIGGEATKIEWTFSQRKFSSTFYFSSSQWKFTTSSSSDLQTSLNSISCDTTDVIIIRRLRQSWVIFNYFIYLLEVFLFLHVSLIKNDEYALE